MLLLTLPPCIPHAGTRRMELVVIIEKPESKEPNQKFWTKTVNEICFIFKRLGMGMGYRNRKVPTPVQNSIQQRKKFSDEIFIILTSIKLILMRIIEFEIKTRGNFEKMQFPH